MIKAKWIGAAAMALKIVHLKPLVRRAIQKRLEGEADDLIDDMQSAVAVDKGNLRDSIRREEGSNYPGVKVSAGGTPETLRRGRGYTADEALMVEFGTRERQAQPFFYPAINKRRRKLKNDIADAAGGAAEE